MVGRQGMWNKGKKGLQHHSEEVRKKIGEASRKIALEQIRNGTRKGLFQKGHKELWRGGNKLRHVNYNKYGENNPNWKGGKYEGRIRFLRGKIRNRDGYLCQECLKHQNECNRLLSVHHIDGNGKNNSPYNLITLCVICHAIVHRSSYLEKERYAKKFKENLIMRFPINYYTPEISSSGAVTSLYEGGAELNSKEVYK